MLEKIKKEVKNYAENYNAYTERFKKDRAYIDANFISSGSKWAEEYKKIKEIYDSSIIELRNKSIDFVELEFDNVIKKLRGKIAAGVAPEVVAELELLKMTKVTSDDIKAYLEKYYNSYLVCKVLKELAEERKIEINVLTLTDQIEMTEDLSKRVIEFFKIYNGPLKSYKAELVLKGDIIDKVDEQLNGFISKYGIDELKV